MATLRKEIVVRATPAAVWDAVRDVGALHTRLAPGFVTDCRLDGNARIVTFGNGMVAREEIVTIDDAARRLVWTIVGDKFQHHNGVVEVTPAGDGTRFVWTTDLLPDALAPAIDAMMSQAMPIMQRSLEAAGT